MRNAWVGQDCIPGFNPNFLARLGFAVLSYDKRGTGRSTGERENIGLDADALAGIEILRQRKDIDQRRIGLWGISQGVMIAPQIAVQTNIAFIISVSGDSVSGDAVRGDQAEIETKETPGRQGPIRTECTILEHSAFRSELIHSAA